MKHTEMIEVIRAAELGSPIQRRQIQETGGASLAEWWDDPNPSWNFYFNEYRVKPEPPKTREFYVNIYSDGTPGSTWKEREGALAAIEMTRGHVETIKVREVLE